jgi:hypothetical protein
MMIKSQYIYLFNKFFDYCKVVVMLHILAKICKKIAIIFSHETTFTKNNQLFFLKLNELNAG